MARRKDGEEGASTLVSFLIAVGIFMLAFTILTFFLASLTAQTDTGSAALNARAARLVDTIVTDTGAPADWHLTPDSVTRFGLLEDGQLSRLDLNKFNSTVYGNLSASLSNNAMDYPDSKAGLGLTDGEFHIRTEPVFASGAVDDVVNMSTYRVAYIGQYLGSFPLEAESTPAQSESGALDNLTLDFTNTKHDHVLLSEVYPGIGDKFNDTAVYFRNVLLPRLAGFYYSVDSNVSSNILDPTNGYWHVVNSTVYGGDVTPPSGNHYVTSSKWIGGGQPWDYGIAENDTLVLPSLDFQNASSVNLTFKHYADGVGDTFPSGGDFGSLLYCDVTSSSTGCTALPSFTWNTIYRNIYNNGTANSWASTTFNLTSLAGKKVMLAFHWSTDAFSANDKDGWFIDDINVSGWELGAYKSFYYNDLEYSETYYDGLIIGSEVVQSRLNDTSTEGLLRQAIKDWVFKGRQVYAFGGAAMDQAWLDLIYSGSIVTASGALFLDQSDLTHPILITPNALTYQEYSRSSTTYSVPTSTFTKVIVTADTGNPPLLSVSNSGAVSNGTVILGSYLPHAMSTDEERNFLINILMYGRFRSLYLDYGPSVPRDAVVGSAQRIALIKQDTSSDAPTVEIRVIVYTWGGEK